MDGRYYKMPYLNNCAFTDDFGITIGGGGGYTFLNFAASEPWEFFKPPIRHDPTLLPVSDPHPAQFRGSTNAVNSVPYQNLHSTTCS
jgi:hypothetical protein